MSKAIPNVQLEFLHRAQFHNFVEWRSKKTSVPARRHIFQAMRETVPDGSKPISHEDILKAAGKLLDRFNGYKGTTLGGLEEETRQALLVMSEMPAKYVAYKNSMCAHQF